jgi:hypothetical protein
MATSRPFRAESEQMESLDRSTDEVAFSDALTNIQSAQSGGGSSV